MDAIYSGTLAGAPTQTDPVFGFETVTECPDVPSDAMIPRESWDNPAAYDQAAAHLASLFLDNFKKYEEGTSEGIINGGPKK